MTLKSLTINQFTAIKVYISSGKMMDRNEREGERKEGKEEE